MKKNLFTAIAALTILISAASCKKSDTSTPTTATLSGKWTGATTAPVGPSRYLALTFNTGGSLLVEANNPTTPDLANGSWAVTGDSVRATFTYTGSASGTFSLAGKYIGNATSMDGTIGTGAFTSGMSTFSVTKQ
jgi:hypothetical protein